MSAQLAPRPRKPWVAVIFTFLTPGLGHLYAGHPATALKRYALSLIAGAAALTLVVFAPLGVFTLFLPLLTVVAVYVFVVREAFRLARAAPSDYVPARYNRWYVYLGALAAAALVGEPLRMHYEAFRSPSASMEPTILLDDWFFARKGLLLPTPAVGQVVLFESPEPGVGQLAKRIVGAGGDTLRMERGVLHRNGARLDEQYVARTGTADGWSDAIMSWQRSYLAGPVADNYIPTSRDWGPIVVPRDSFFVLGDNRDASKDSRWFGFIGRDAIVGRPRVVYYTYDRDGDYPLPYLTAIRWNRIGTRIE